MNTKTLMKKLRETTAPHSVIDAVSALISENEQLTEKLFEVAKEANNILYFDDSSDFATALWEILATVFPHEYGEEMEVADLEYIEMSKDGRSEMIDMENDKLKSTLRQIGQAVTPGAFNSQLENWILAQVEGALNDEN